MHLFLHIFLLPFPYIIVYQVSCSTLKILGEHLFVNTTFGFWLLLSNGKHCICERRVHERKDQYLWFSPVATFFKKKITETQQKERVPSEPLSFFICLLRK